MLLCREGDTHKRAEGANITKSWADREQDREVSLAIACLKAAVGTLMTEWSLGI